MGFALSIIKFNQDVVARCFSALLNLSFQVQIDTAGHLQKGEIDATGHGVAAEQSANIHLAETVEMLTPGLGKMYVIQAGLVIVPIFFIWLVAHRARVEEVQIAIHNRSSHHNEEHPDP